MKTESKIIVLPEEVANKIAAGEVVERPASVVKELVENSIDAGARHVSIQVKRAGKESIAVADDGAGMSAGEAALSLKRHATSKISGIEDLDDIRTLGFRGEALPTIASVSRMVLTTRTRDSDGATRLTVEGGAVASSEAVAGPPGTSIQAEDLFYNTPARLKFLKTDATELRNIVDIVGKIALVNPAVGIELESDGRKLLALPPDQGVEARADELTGGSKLYWVSVASGERRLRFAFSAPHEGRGRSNGIKLFVNRRAVSDRLLFRAVMDGYRGLIGSGRYPVALLWLELPPGEVDVNVHPAKREVRFADEGRLFGWVSGNIAKALSASPWAVGGGDSEALPANPSPWSAGATKDHDPDKRGADRVAEALAGYGASLRAGAGQGSFSPHRTKGGLPFSPRVPRYDSAAQGEAAAIECVYGNLRPLGSFDATYLLFEDEGTRELVLIDQHAAHERVLYEKLLQPSAGSSVNAVNAANSPAQQLLVPVVVECSADEMAVYEERKEALATIGFTSQPFGSRSLSVIEAPKGLTSAQITAIVKDALSDDENAARDLHADMTEKWAARAACSAAVKARRRLTPSEVVALLTQLGGLQNPTHCPHGRPLILRLGREAVERLFHRR